jgi:PIN domain nuclease of toxin-antitoxin system
MKLLLDTNALIWWMDDEPMLGSKSRQLIAHPGHVIYVSVVSLWEITLKWRIGKYPLPGSAYQKFLAEERVDLMEVSSSHVVAVEGLAMHHKDPFDHLLLAQAKVEGASIITSDREMADYGIKCFPAGR